MAAVAEDTKGIDGAVIKVMTHNVLWLASKVETVEQAIRLATIENKLQVRYLDSFSGYIIHSMGFLPTASVFSFDTSKQSVTGLFSVASQHTIYTGSKPITFPAGRYRARVKWGVLASYLEE